jgi:hypothetical protein
MSKTTKAIKKLVWRKEHPNAISETTQGAFGQARQFAQVVEHETDDKFLTPSARKRKAAKLASLETAMV